MSRKLSNSNVRKPGLSVLVLAWCIRLDLREEFTTCFIAEAARKPNGAAAASLERGLVQGLTSNVLEDTR